MGYHRGVRATIHCTACDGRKIWRIDPVRDRDLSSEIMAVWFTASNERVGHFEMYVCAGCGICEWWAAGLEPTAPPGDRDARLAVDELPACTGCRATRTWIVPMLDAITGADPQPMSIVAGPRAGAGRLIAWICADCGLTLWRARGLEAAIQSVQMKPSTRACASCASVATYTAPSPDATLIERRAAGRSPTLRWERRGIVTHTGFWGLQWRGKLDLHVCSACGRVDWLGRSLEQLRPDPAAGVTLLDSTVEPSGPYR